MNAALIEKETERRAAERYSIERDIRWKLHGRKSRELPVRGRTVNISSAGVLFTTGSSLTLGKLLEVAISWPVLLDADGEMQLIARGRVVRAADGRAAIHFNQRELQARDAQL